MTKSELLALVAEKSGLSQKDSEAVLDGFVATLTAALKKNDKVAYPGLGAFEAKVRSAREGINPKTQEKIKIAASKAPAFKAAKQLKDALNSK